MARHQDLTPYGLENRTYTLAEWQAIEKRTGEKFEYHEGRLVPWRMMAGGSPVHALLSSNFVGSVFKVFTKDERAFAQCNTYSSDLQLKIAQAGHYVYPDAAIVCGQPRYDEAIKSAITNPTVVVEVLSPSSVRYDMGQKFDFYARYDSLREYVLVDQDEYAVEVRSRTKSDGKWTYAFIQETAEHVAIPSLGLSLPMTELYRGIEFDDGEGDVAAAVPA